MFRCQAKMLEMRLLLKKIGTLLKDHFSDHSSKFDYEYALGDEKREKLGEL